VEEFAAAFAEHAAGVLTPEDLRPVTPVDAVVRGSELTLGLCEELERLAPFGLGNPNVTLLAVGAELSDLGAVGEGKHLRLAVTAGGARSGAIAFGRGGALDRFRRPGSYDVAFRLTANRWNGTVAPQLVVREIFETSPRFEELRRLLLAEWKAEPERRSAWATEVFAELGLDEDPAGWRPLAESPAFLEALRDEPAAEAA
jgi:single-stranded-DNA-specific exonuclease